MTWIELVLLVGIVVRVTLLIVQDDLLDPWRDRAQAWACRRARARDDHGRPTSGLPRWAWFVSSCPWCCSPYVATGAWALWRYAPEDVFLAAGVVCLGSLAAGIAGERL